MGLMRVQLPEIALSLAALLLIGAVPAAAQQTGADPLAGELDPDAPLAPLPDMEVAWPDLATDLPVDPAARPDPAFPADTAPPVAVSEIDATEGERRYSVAVEGLDGVPRETVMTRFRALSRLEDRKDERANVAQIDRRAREDAALLDNLLRAEGHYDAQIDTEISGNDPVAVVFRIEPGPLYRFESVALTGLDATGGQEAELLKAFAVAPNDPVSADKVLGGKAALEGRLRASGFPFAIVPDPEVVVDHETQRATLSLAVRPGELQRFGAIRLEATKPPFSARHVQRIARFRPGEVFDQAKLDDLERALIATGLLSTADTKPVPSGTPGIADVLVAMETAPLRTIAGEIGYGTGEGFRAEVSWTHRNLIRPEGAVTLRGVAGTQEQYVGAILRQSNFRKRDQVLNARFIVQNTNRRAFDARSIEIGAGIERQTNILWQKKWTWSLGTELVATDERDLRRSIQGGRRTFFVGAFPATLSYDGSNDLLDPTRGFRLSARVSPEISFQDGKALYVRAQLDGSAYVPVNARTTIAGRARLGSILGASANRIAPSRRLYAGGGGSIRGFAFQRVGPVDIAGDPAGGTSVVEFALEARLRFGDFGVVPFVDAGNVYRSRFPTLGGMRYGAGIGGRYHSSFGPIRIDLGTPLNPRPGDPKVTVFVSLGQAF